MWELNLFKRIVPAFAIVLVSVILYIISKYVLNGMFSAFNSTGIDPTSWGLGYWLLALLPIIIVWFWIMRAWMIISGRLKSGSEDRLPSGRKPSRKSQGIGPFPPEQNIPF